MGNILQGLNVKGGNVKFINRLPTNSIIWFGGEIISIPSGFIISTDLQNNFIIGAGDTYDPDDTGGTSTHTHTGTIASHFHSLLTTGKIKMKDFTLDGWDKDSDNNSASLTTDSSANLPTYLALAFISSATEQALPDDVIVGWARGLDTIPTGFSVCDGTSGTRDMQDNFIVGAGDTYSVGDTGGTTSHTHTGTSNSHNHDLPEGTDLDLGSNRNENLNASTVTFTTDSTANLPPYHALIYIQNTSGTTQEVKAGMIVIHQGSVASIEAGYTLCDGDSGSPDLTDEFIVGAGDTYEDDETGGATEHSHIGTSNSHSHRLAKTGLAQQDAGGTYSILSDSKTPALTTTDTNHLPPYIAKAYKMKT